jgi:hypothetical protein
MFYITQEAIDNAKYGEERPEWDLGDLVGVKLQMGTTGGALPTRVVLILQYWQRTE